LTFLNTFEEVGKASRDAAGWHSCLDTLAYSLGEREAPWSAKEHWLGLHRRYVASFGAKASTVGPPAEHPYME
jgi:hypothetical protein